MPKIHPDPLGVCSQAAAAGVGNTMGRHNPGRHRALSDPDLCTRTSWVDARTAYHQVKKGRAFGNSCALLLRMHLQEYLYKLGVVIQRHCGKVLFVGLLLLSIACVGLKTASIETDVERLWVEEGGRLQAELHYMKQVLGEGSGAMNELIVIQTPKSEDSSVINVDSLLLHQEALLAATEISVHMFDT